MKWFALYDPSTGEVITTGSAPDNMVDLQSAPGLNRYVGQVDPVHQYIDVTDPANPVVADKQPLPYTVDKTTVVADGVDIVTISGLPDSAEVEVSGAVATPTAGVVELTFASPGDYTVQMRAFPYLDAEVTIHAT